jgi:hypothetical protein
MSPYEVFEYTHVFWFPDNTPHSTQFRVRLAGFWKQALGPSEAYRALLPSQAQSPTLIGESAAVYPFGTPSASPPKFIPESCV